MLEIRLACWPLDRARAQISGKLTAVTLLGWHFVSIWIVPASVEVVVGGLTVGAQRRSRGDFEVCVGRRFSAPWRNPGRLL